MDGVLSANCGASCRKFYGLIIYEVLAPRTEAEQHTLRNSMGGNSSAVLDMSRYRSRSALVTPASCCLDAEVSWKLFTSSHISKAWKWISHWNTHEFKEV